jgi:uncharacterized protein YyaL (SSP411 family)
MTATQAMTGQGGWPMTGLRDPDGEPFSAARTFRSRPSRGLLDS